MNHILFSIVGAFFRRFFGGWENLYPHMVKVLIGYALMFWVALSTTHNLYAALVFGIVMGTAFLNPLHSWGQGMGRVPGRTLRDCIVVMGGSYGLFTIFGAASLIICTGQLKWAFYALTGFLTPVGYLFGYWFFDKFRKNPDGTYRAIWETTPGEWFIDVPTAIGELSIGALLFSL